jgi:hypothetical protein
MQEIEALQNDSDRDVRENVIMPSSDTNNGDDDDDDDEKTESMTCEIPDEISTAPTLPPPFNAISIEIIETPPPANNSGSDEEKQVEKKEEEEEDGNKEDNSTTTIAIAGDDAKSDVEETQQSDA